jgi:hypothetical protein
MQLAIEDVKRRENEFKVGYCEEIIYIICFSIYLFALSWIGKLLSFFLIDNNQ